MSGTIGPSTILLAVAVVAAVGAFFAYVAYRFWSYGRHMSAFLDRRAQRRREQADYEARHGTPPAWKQATRRLIQLLLIAAAFGLAWFRLRGS